MLCKALKGIFALIKVCTKLLHKASLSVKAKPNGYSVLLAWFLSSPPRNFSIRTIHLLEVQEKALRWGHISATSLP